MHIYSRLSDDVPHNLQGTGAYEWWYFDVIDWKNELSAVIIFYRGNPFSRRYIVQEENGENPKAEQFPAYSISIYKNTQTEFFHFREFEPTDSIQFSDDRIQLGEVASIERKGNVWRVKINDQRPDGVKLELDLKFDGTNFPINNGFSDEIPSNESPHAWNLLHSRTQVTGTTRISKNVKTRHAFSWDGLGYHDHNFGNEPMKNGFRDWIWARFHFPDETLVLYSFRNSDTWDFNVWRFDHSTNLVSQSKSVKGLSTRFNFPTLFGLRAPNTFSFSIEGTDYSFDSYNAVDSGPFYIRYIPRLYRENRSDDREFVYGISEYIKPKRIYERIFWPLVNMRMRYDAEKPHWVQGIEFFFNWTL